MTRQPLPHLALLVALMAAFPLASRTLAQETCGSALCHGPLLARGNLHAATESCDGCHETVAEPHPQKGKRTFKLTSEPPALCADCHDATGKKAHVHSPVKEGMCTTCHDPHSSEQPKLLTAALAQLCADCHSEATASKHPHGPVSAGECLSCHTPHESEQPALLLKPGDELCFSCHGELKALLAKKSVHAAIDNGCTTCHDPHGSPAPKLLVEQGVALCARCHDTVVEQAQRAAVPHAALEAEGQCAACHSPHASDNAKLLLETEKKTCLGCHEKTVSAAMTVLHGPLRDGKCTACHAPHGAANPALLNGDFPAAAYVPYTDRAYALCFGCHRRDLLQYPDTSFATGFRDGEKNLHFVHVNNATKGRSCKLCHATHGGTNDRLIAVTVPFGQWTLPLKFVQTENGGKCSPGCHKPLSYDRKAAGRKPETPGKAARPQGAPAPPAPTRPTSGRP